LGAVAGKTPELAFPVCQIDIPVHAYQYPGLRIGGSYVGSKKGITLFDKTTDSANILSMTGLAWVDPLIYKGRRDWVKGDFFLFLGYTKPDEGKEYKNGCYDESHEIFSGMRMEKSSYNVLLGLTVWEKKLPQFY
jgi:hypothetical protein